MIKLILLVLIILTPVIIIAGTAWKALEYRRTRHDRALENIKQLERKLDIT